MRGTNQREHALKIQNQWTIHTGQQKSNWKNYVGLPLLLSVKHSPSTARGVKLKTKKYTHKNNLEGSVFMHQSTRTKAWVVGLSSVSPLFPLLSLDVLLKRDWPFNAKSGLWDNKSLHLCLSQSTQHQKLQSFLSFSFLSLVFPLPLHHSFTVLEFLLYLWFLY